MNYKEINNVKIYELKGEAFFMPVHATSIENYMDVDNQAPWRKSTDNDTISLSIISDKFLGTYRSPSDCVVFGFNKLDEKNIMHMYHSDSFTSHRYQTDVKNEILTPEKLIDNTKGYNEILVMEDEEVQALEQVATLTCRNGTPQIMHANAIVFLVHTGLRCGELQALKWSDIDFVNETVTVSKNLSMIVNRDRKPGQKHRNAKIKGTKTVSGNRIVPLNEKAVHALRSLQQIYRMLGVRNDLVLVSRNGKVLSNAQLRRVLDRVLRKANIDKPFTLHQLRHTFATRTLKAGVPISVVSKWLGHANISTTYNTYIHVLCSEEKDAAELLKAM